MQYYLYENEQNKSRKRNGLTSEFRSIHWQFAHGRDEH